MNPNENYPEAGPIDAVITWVDGSDPAHIAKREAALLRDRGWSLTAIPAGRAATRFTDNGELGYCIAAIRRFVPWIRTIHVVTDAQRPSFLDDCTCRDLRVGIVDHTEIFRGYEWALPTFNSRSIETMIHRIEGLADRFLYFNDDFLIMKPTDPDAFFRGSRVVLRGDWLPLPQFGRIRMLVSGLANHVLERILGRQRPMHILPQIRSAQMAGITGHFLKTHHIPFPVLRSTIEGYFEENPAAMTANIQHRFRNMRQFNTMPLSVHLEIASNNHVFESDSEHLTLAFTGRKAPAATQALSDIERNHPRFLCLQSLDRASEKQRERVHRLLRSVIGDLAQKDQPDFRPNQL